jgi:hypothetical protein
VTSGCREFPPVFLRPSARPELPRANASA